MRRTAILIVAICLIQPWSAARGAPAPGIGLLTKADEMPALRAKIQQEPWSGMYAKIKADADKALKAWPATRSRITPHLSALLDLSVDHANVPADPAVRQAGKDLGAIALGGMCPAAFVYLISGEKSYADLAYDILLHMGKVNRWGWFPWAGVHMPQIHAGMYFRNAAFTLDFIWDALTGAQRQEARRIIAAKAVEPYYRLVLHSPAMGLHHLRSKNQGSNVLGGAVIACLALGDGYPDAEIWRRSYIQTFHWIVTHDIGWAGQGLESGLPGYWSVSMQNLYTAATCLYNVTGIDLRVHPAFAEATYYPIYHETTVPPVGAFAEPIAADFSGPCGIIAGKPIELPHAASGGPWWYDYAARFPDSPARYFINRTMVRKDAQGRLSFRIHDCHQHGHSEIIGLLWAQQEATAEGKKQESTAEKKKQEFTAESAENAEVRNGKENNAERRSSKENNAERRSNGKNENAEGRSSEKGRPLHDPGVDQKGPTALFKTTDRMSMIRSGYGMGQTYLYFNGDIFLSALGEILCTTSGLAWHYRWHGWQKGETGLETEGEPLAPSMVVKDSWHDDGFTFISTASGTSNIRYYMPAGQNDCWRHYERRDRDILYVRGLAGKGDGYFIFVDRVAQAQPRWHGWLWQTWNNVHANNRANYGRYKAETPTRVRLERPNADLALEFVAPREVAFEIESAPGQPIVSYMYDHNVLTLRALAGGYGPAKGGTLTVPPSAWKGPGKVLAGAQLGEGAPKAAYRLVGAEQIVKGDNALEVLADLAPGMRYRMRIACRKQDLRVYENLAWELDVELLDADGKVLARDTDPADRPAEKPRPREYNRPGELRLGDPRSLTPTTPWLDTEYVHFDVPPDAKVAKVRWRLTAATWSHPPSKIHEKSVLDLGPITIEPVGEARRQKAETFVAIATPLKKGAAAPAVRRGRADGGVWAEIPRADGSVDRLFVPEGNQAEGLVLMNVADGKVRRVFARRAKDVSLGEHQFLLSPVPVDLGLRMDPAGKVVWAKVAATKPVEVAILGRKVRLEAGLFVAGADPSAEEFAPDPAGAQLQSNSPTSRKLLKAGLAPLIAQCIAQRDAYTAKGMTNLAASAKVTASATLDPRFAPGHVIDNRTWEYPTDGLLDYTLGEIRTSPSGGYDRGRTPLTGPNMSVWPLYVRPTYWLLPYEKTGWIELELPAEARVGWVRLLNTSNAGLNDYATMRYRVELRDGGGRVVAERKGAFGKCFDRPFGQAFRFPDFFSSYGETFKGTLEPGVPVPFGDGWQEVRFEPARARRVRVYVESYWAIGGGLNEIQVYAAPDEVSQKGAQVSVRLTARKERK